VGIQQCFFTSAIVMSLGLWSLPGLSSFAADPQIQLMHARKLPSPASKQGAVVVGNRLYVMGGMDNTSWTNNVISASITAEGHVGEWRKETPMPDYRAYLGGAVEAVNNRIYVFGGLLLAGPTTSENDAPVAGDVLWTEVQGDGTLAPWKRSPGPEELQRSCVATCADDQFVFITGGQRRGEVADYVLRAEFNENGEPGVWSHAGKLPVPLWFHGSSLINDRLYIWGGLSQSQPTPANKHVWSAGVRKDGTIEPWREEAPLPKGVYSSAFCGFNDYLVALGGRFEGGYPNTGIFFARVEHGRVGAWQSLTSNLEASIYIALGLDRTAGNVYVTGGQLKTKPGPALEKQLANIQAFHLPQPQKDIIDANLIKTSGSMTGVGALDAALETARAARKNVAVFFFSPQVPRSKTFWDELNKSPFWERHTQEAITAVVDVTHDQQNQYKFSAFRVPCVVVIAPDGGISQRAFRMDDLK